MLKLDSQRWEELTHAYGSAQDTPDLIRRIYADPTNDDWSELYGTVAHQGDIFDSAYATAPHIIAASKSVPRKNRLDYVCFVSYLEMGYDRKPIPPDLKTDYKNCLERTKSIALDLLTEEWDYGSTIYLLQAISSLYGQIGLAHVVEGLADGEFQIQCPECGQDLYVEVEEQSFITYAQDPVRFRNLNGHPVVPRSVGSGQPGTPASAEIAWLSELAAPIVSDSLRMQLELMNGDSLCPKCKRHFNLYEVAV